MWIALDKANKKLKNYKLLIIECHGKRKTGTL